MATHSHPQAFEAALDAVELMRDHPERPWSTAELARATAVSVRSLQETFQRELHMPPMTYLLDIRLTRAHDDLHAAAPGTTTVTAVAGRWGFVHLGRFSMSYRRKFGEPPSHTLRGRHAQESADKASPTVS